MEHISKKLKKYSPLAKKQSELEVINKKIIKATNIKPQSLKIKNNTLYIKASNNYEALELRFKIDKIKAKIIYKIIII